MSLRTGGYSSSPPSKPATVVSPPRCPACGSMHVVSPDKIPDANSYWRCVRCEEVWSPDRQLARPTRSFR